MGCYPMKSTSFEACIIFQCHRCHCCSNLSLLFGFILGLLTSIVALGFLLHALAFWWFMSYVDSITFSPSIGVTPPPFLALPHFWLWVVPCSSIQAALGAELCLMICLFQIFLILCYALGCLVMIQPFWLLSWDFSILLAAPEFLSAQV